MAPTGRAPATYIAQKPNGGNTFEVGTDAKFPNGDDPQVVGSGIVDKNTQLIDSVLNALQTLIDVGSYQKIITKYGLLPVNSAEINAGKTPLLQ